MIASIPEYIMGIDILASMTLSLEARRYQFEVCTLKLAFSEIVEKLVVPHKIAGHWKIS